MKVKIKRIDKSLPLLQYQTRGAVAFDFYSREDLSVPARTTKILPSNFIIEVPEGYFLMISARSSLAKKGLILANGVGIIDQDYHGPDDEIGISVYNFSDSPVQIKKGDRLAQGLIIPVERVEWEEGEQMGENSRGGFGSTG